MPPLTRPPPPPPPEAGPPVFHPRPPPLPRPCVSTATQTTGTTPLLHSEPRRCADPPEIAEDLEEQDPQEIADLEEITLMWAAGTEFRGQVADLVAELADLSSSAAAAAAADSSPPPVVDHHLPSTAGSVDWIQTVLGVDAAASNGPACAAALRAFAEAAVAPIAAAAAPAPSPGRTAAAALAAVDPAVVAGCRFIDGGAAFFGLVAARLKAAKALQAEVSAVETAANSPAGEFTFGDDADFHVRAPSLNPPITSLLRQLRAFRQRSRPTSAWRKHRNSGRAAADDRTAEGPGRGAVAGAHGGRALRCRSQRSSASAAITRLQCVFDATIRLRGFGGGDHVGRILPPLDDR